MDGNYIGALFVLGFMILFFIAIHSSEIYVYFSKPQIGSFWNWFYLENPSPFWETQENSRFKFAEVIMYDPNVKMVKLKIYEKLNNSNYLHTYYHDFHYSVLFNLYRKVKFTDLPQMILDDVNKRS